MESQILLTDTIRIPLVVASTGELYIPTFFPVSHHPKLKKLFPQISISLDIDYNEFNPGSIFNKIMSSQHRKETSTIPSPPSGYSPIVFYTEEANILKNLIDIRREIDQFFEKKFELESAIGSIQSFLPTLNNFQKFQELEDHKKLIQKLLDDVSQLKLEEAYLSFDKIASKLEELAIRDKKRDFIDSQPDLKDNNPIGYHTFRFNHILTTTESDSPNQKTIRDLFNLLTEIWQKYNKGKALIETLEIKNGYLNELCNICQGNFTASKMNGIFQKFSQNTKTTVMKGKSILTALKKIVQDSQSEDIGKKRQAFCDFQTLNNTIINEYCESYAATYEIYNTLTSSISKLFLDVYENNSQLKQTVEAIPCLKQISEDLRSQYAEFKSNFSKILTDFQTN